MKTRTSRRTILKGSVAAAVATALPRLSWAEDEEYLPAVPGRPVPRPSAFDKDSTAEDVTKGMDLAGLTALVTGCNSGLGLETMRVLTMRGAHVIGAARTTQKAEEACASVGGKTTPLAVELTDLPGIVGVVEDPIVSSDVIGNPHSLLFDAKGTIKAGNNTIKTLSWYENLGHAARLLDVVRLYRKLDLQQEAA